MTRAADDPIVRAEIHDALSACGLDPVTEGAIDGVIALAGAGTSYYDAARFAAFAINRHPIRVPGTRRIWEEHPTQGDGLIAQADYARFSGQLDALLDGATTTGEPNAWPANAGEYAARWNAHDTQWREDHVTHQVDTAQRASRCIEHDHEDKIRYLEQGWKDSTNAWHRVHQHPKVAALDNHYMPLVDQVLHALHQPHEDTALAEGDDGDAPDLDALLSELETCAWFTDGTKNGELVDLAHFTRHRIAKGLRDAIAALAAVRARPDEVVTISNSTEADQLPPGSVIVDDSGVGPAWIIEDKIVTDSAIAGWNGRHVRGLAGFGGTAYSVKYPATLVHTPTAGQEADRG